MVAWAAAWIAPASASTEVAAGDPGVTPNLYNPSPFMNLTFAWDMVAAPKATFSYTIATHTTLEGQACVPRPTIIESERVVTALAPTHFAEPTEFPMPAPMGAAFIWVALAVAVSLARRR